MMGCEVKRFTFFIFCFSLCIAQQKLYAEGDDEQVAYISRSEINRIGSYFSNPEFEKCLEKVDRYFSELKKGIDSLADLYQTYREIFSYFSSPKNEHDETLKYILSVDKENHGYLSLKRQLLNRLISERAWMEKYLSSEPDAIHQQELRCFDKAFKEGNLEYIENNLYQLFFLPMGLKYIDTLYSFYVESGRFMEANRILEIITFSKQNYSEIAKKIYLLGNQYRHLNYVHRLNALSETVHNSYPDLTYHRSKEEHISLTNLFSYSQHPGKKLPLTSSAVQATSSFADAYISGEHHFMKRVFTANYLNQDIVPFHILNSEKHRLFYNDVMMLAVDRLSGEVKWSYIFYQGPAVLRIDHIFGGIISEGKILLSCSDGMRDVLIIMDEAEGKPEFIKISNQHTSHYIFSKPIYVPETGFYYFTTEESEELFLYVFNLHAADKEQRIYKKILLGKTRVRTFRDYDTDFMLSSPYYFEGKLVVSNDTGTLFIIDLSSYEVAAHPYALDLLLSPEEAHESTMVVKNGILYIIPSGSLHLMVFDLRPFFGKEKCMFSYPLEEKTKIIGFEGDILFVHYLASNMMTGFSYQRGGLTEIDKRFMLPKNVNQVQCSQGWFFFSDYMSLYGATYQSSQRRWKMLNFMMDNDIRDELMSFEVKGEELIITTLEYVQAYKWKETEEDITSLIHQNGALFTNIYQWPTFLLMHKDWRVRTWATYEIESKGPEGLLSILNVVKVLNEDAIRSRLSEIALRIVERETRRSGSVKPESIALVSEIFKSELMKARDIRMKKRVISVCKALANVMALSVFFEAFNEDTDVKWKAVEAMLFLLKRGDLQDQILPFLTEHYHLIKSRQIRYKMLHGVLSFVPLNKVRSFLIEAAKDMDTDLKEEAESVLSLFDGH